MLQDYIDQYREAVETGDNKEMTRIEKDLAKLGMDRHTLNVLLVEQYKREGAFQ